MRKYSSLFYTVTRGLLYFKSTFFQFLCFVLAVYNYAVLVLLYILLFAFWRPFEPRLVLQRLLFDVFL